jgi:hypothetical protein
VLDRSTPKGGSANFVEEDCGGDVPQTQLRDIYRKELQQAEAMLARAA